MLQYRFAFYLITQMEHETNELFDWLLHNWGVMRTPLRWVLWDIKDTLLRVRFSVGEQYCKEAEQMGLTLNPVEVNSAFRQAYKSYSRRYPNYGKGQGLNGHSWWTAVVKDTFSSCGVQDSTLLQTLSTISIITFAMHRIGRYLKIQKGSGEEAGVAKPSLLIFEQALKKCGVSAAHVAHVGDHYINDYLASRSLGIHGFLLDRDNKLHSV
ncbi:hypothetical protein WMY93_012350 [Mugilogobius chulae]|uniref:Haloacid dehalogenase-like hydrolase domain-containing protein 3 n=1 Tax=Mugilogobius chulae TaxID=88201 RepID=A0AAW0PFE5_9GOBI